MKKVEIRNIDIDYDKFFDDYLKRKLAVLQYWLVKKKTDGSDKEYLIELIIDKWEYLYGEIHGKEIEIDYQYIFYQNKFLQKLYSEFERRKKLNHSKFVTYTLNAIPQIQKETGNLGTIEKADYMKLVKSYAHYKAYETISENWRKNVLGVTETAKVDNRIKGKLCKEEIEKYFRAKFSEKQNDSNPILSEDKIKDFLHANFADFFPKVEIKKNDTPFTSQQKLRTIIHEFHLKHNPKNRTEAYVNLLLLNFCKFDNTTFRTEKKNFGKKK